MSTLKTSCEEKGRPLYFYIQKVVLNLLLIYRALLFLGGMLAGGGSIPGNRGVMQVVVKRPHTKMEGEISTELIAFLKERYGDVDVIENEDDELAEIIKTEWYRDIRHPSKHF